MFCWVLYSWALTPSLGKGVRRHNVRNVNNRHQEFSERDATDSFYLATARTLYILLEPRHSILLTLCGHPSVTGHNQELWQHQDYYRCLLIFWSGRPYLPTFLHLFIYNVGSKQEPEIFLRALDYTSWELCNWTVCVRQACQTSS